MIGPGQMTVFCNSLDCDNQTRLPMYATASDKDTREAILDNGWYITLNGKHRSVTIETENATPFSEINAQQLQELLTSPDFPFKDDEHHCSIACVEKDT